MSIFKKLGWFFKAEKKHYIIGIIALIVVAIVQLIPPKIIGVIIDEIDGRLLTSSRLVMWISILVVAASLQYVFRFIWRTNIWGSAARLERSLRERLFRHFTKMDHEFYQQHRTGDLMAHATNDVSAVQNVAGAGILTFADSLITGISTIVAMVLFVDWRLTILAMIPLPLLAVTSRVLGSKIHAAFRESQAAFSTINDKAQESITGMKVIKTFGQEKEDIADFETKIEQAIVKNQRVNRLDALFDPAITLIIGLSYVLTIIIGGRYVMNETITIGQLVSFVSYIGMLVWPMFAIGRLFNVIERGNASYDRIEALLAHQTHIIEEKHGIKTKAQGDVMIAINEFHYPKQNAIALQDIQITIKEGQTLGLVGKTGAGKTTLLKLLLREYDHFNGKILFGQHGLSQYTLDALLQSIGYVPQDHFLFSMTILDNIRFANPTLAKEQVYQAAKMAAIHEDILQLPQGYDTMVGERGVSLSGGQKQRLSIARALVVRPELLILDDALSAVDAKTEEKILTQLRTEHHRQTTIIAAHRLSSVMHADEIVVFDEGKITERGTHHELLAYDGWYRKMWEKQQLEAKIEGGEA
ncbi:ABC transporter ATP-binding protein [Enterococcus bulliens]